MDLPWYVLLGVILVVTFVVVPYALGPILVFSTLKFRTPVEVVPVDPREVPLPAQVRPHFQQTYEELLQDEFQLAGTMALPAVVPNVQSILALYVNRRARDMAMATFVTTTGVETLKTQYVEFYTRFSDGTAVQTNNSRELSSFPPKEHEYTYQFWQISDTRRLYQLHKRLLDRHRRAGQPELPLDSEYGGDAVRYVAQAVLEKTFAEQEQTGYLRRTAEGYRPTIWGALIMTWKELWPWKAIRRKGRQRAAQQVLAEAT